MERKLISDGGIPKQEKQIYVKQALEQMNPELKEIIIMFYFQDFKLKEIADILQILSLIHILCKEKFYMSQQKGGAGYMNLLFSDISHC